MSASLETLFSEATEAETNGVLSAGVVAVDKTGNPFILKGFGRRTFSSASANVDPDSIFALYSITKTVTAIACLQCVQRGQIELDAPIYTVLPELREFQILSISEKGSIELKPHSESITLRHLLSHTSGIGMDYFDPRLQAWRKSRGEENLAFCGRSKDAYTLPLLFEPGQGWAYGGGLEWAGIVVERLNNMKLGEYMKKHIFEPLGMASTTFRPHNDEKISGRLVEMTARIPDGKLVPIPPPYTTEPEDDSGALGLFSSLSDWAKITADLLQDQPSILSKDYVGELFKAQFGPNTPAAFALKFGGMMYGRLVQDEYSPANPNVGQAPGSYLTLTDTPGLPSHTLFMTGIPNEVWLLNREMGVGALYVSAVMPPDDAKSTELIGAFLREVFKRE